MSILELLADAQPTGLTGSVVETTGLLATVADLPAPVGAVVQIGAAGGAGVEAEVVGFRGRLTMVSPLGPLAGVRRGQPVRLKHTKRRIAVGDGLLGRVVDASGAPIDGLPRPALSHRTPIDAPPTRALDRPPIRAPLATGVRAIDALLTCGRGQRLGVFAGSGVGKSTLLGMMTRYTSADVVVTALVGERGREVNEFLENDLGPDGRRKSVVVVATSDEPAVMRVRAASTASAIAEHFRDTGKHVLLLVDSLTRTALASRESGLAAGEPPTTRGYPPSTFALLPKIVERAGATRAGSITAFYSVLVEGDDPDDPIADCLRGLLDGHVWLSRRLAGKGHFPSIDVTQSISRLAPQITPPEQQQAAARLRGMLAALAENEDLISIGAYRRGANAEVDAALDLRSEIDDFLRQRVDEPSDPAEAASRLAQIAQKAAAAGRPRPAGVAAAQPLRPAN
ncbi:FliI/YscN family ATPase [Botrimarina sp.]|uniref:FliI/YscN family ATPase n=1 Tax=Botrimarina sp. TaxID=2795802 RepID=UPI0032EE3DDA